MPTLKDVAKATGFSVTTVSRALNGYDDVNEETKEIIEKVARKLNYSPNIIAQNLVKKKSKTIGIIVNELKRESAKDNLMFEMLCGVSDALEVLGYEFILISTSTSKQKNQTFEQICSQRQLAGVIIQGLKMNDSYLEEAKVSDIPCVLIDIPVTGKSIKYVTTNQQDSVKDAIKYLYRLNHRYIAYLNGTAGAHVSGVRKLGYEEALKELGLDVNPDYIIQGDFDEEVAKKNVIPFLINHPEVTAIFCASDVMALGALQAVKSLGINVPKQLSIIGFDNILLTEYVTPKLTTIAQSSYDIAKMAVQELIELIENPDTQTTPKIIQNELIIKESTAPAPILV